jgi:hypothetical protein
MEYLITRSCRRYFDPRFWRTDYRLSGQRRRAANLGCVFMRLVLSILSCLLLLAPMLACNRTQPNQTSVTTSQPATTATTNENYPNLMTQAKEMNDAFARRDYERFADLTYPKVVEMAGGRDQMLKGIPQQLKEMEAEGVVILSSTSGSPTQFVHDSGSIYAVLPATLKAKAKDGVFESEGSLVGISSDGGTNWTFIDASGKDHRELKTILGNVVDRLNLPPDKRPVKISNSD